MAAKGFIEFRKKDILVGARYDSGDDGACARVDYDKTWLHITTDDYEGHAMLNIEALPYLRRALARIAKDIKAKGPPS